MFHFRKNVLGWPESIHRLPDNYCIKAVDNVQMLAETKSINSTITTILRHWVAHQHPASTYTENREIARRLFWTFIDDTFRNGSTAGWNHADATDYVEDWNEYFGATQSPDERAAFINWALAAIDVWYQEFWPEVGSDLCIANVPIGNDLPIQVAERVDYWTGDGRLPRIGYHSYWPVQDHIIPNDEWKWYSGRWTEMDKRFRQAGLTVHWALTEAGAIGYHGEWPNIGLNPNDGWRHSHVHNHNIERYLESIDYFMDKWQEWNRTHQNRCLPPNLYDTFGLGDPAWKDFQILQPDLNIIADHVDWEYPVQPTEIEMLKGIDISHWQGNINWTQAAEAGIRFAFCKATEGINYIDPNFQTNVEGAEEANIIPGAYHFFQPGYGGLEQAQHFIDVIGWSEQVRLVAVDVEIAQGVDPTLIRSRLDSFIRNVKREGWQVGLYTSNHFYDRYLQGLDWPQFCYLWIAHWDVVVPTTPDDFNNWTFWQYKVLDSGSEYGVSGRLDVDFFNGTEEMLQTLARRPNYVPEPIRNIRLIRDANIRLSPSLHSVNRITTLPADTILLPDANERLVTGTEVSGNNQWYKVQSYFRPDTGAHELPIYAYVWSGLAEDA